MVVWKNNNTRTNCFSVWARSFEQNQSGYHGSRGAGVAGGSEAHRNTSSSTKMKSQLSFTAGGPQTAAHLSRISEGASLFPGADVVRGAAHSGGEHPVSRSFSASGSSGGFSIVGPWDESREIIGTLDLGGYEPQVRTPDSGSWPVSIIGLSHSILSMSLVVVGAV